MRPSVNNYKHVAPFVPETFDGDTFIYTELLNRSRKSGNNKGRLVRTFYHRSRDEFAKQMEDIVSWCDYTGSRAMTRLSPRSFRKVGQYYTKHIVEQSLAGNWEGMRHGYSHACGVSAPIKKYWLWDVDVPATELSAGDWFPANKIVFGCVPSRKGYHLITEPFDVRPLQLPEQVTLHKDNPTNLYIPAEAA